MASGDVVRPGWEEVRSTSVADTASSFLQGARNQFGSVVPGGEGDGAADWQAELRHLQSRGPLMPPQHSSQQPTFKFQASSPPPQQQVPPSQQLPAYPPQPPPQQQQRLQSPPPISSFHSGAGFAPPPSQQPSPYHQPPPPPPQQQQQPPPPPMYESTLLTEEEFQCNSAIEFGGGIALDGCTVDKQLVDGDPFPALEHLCTSVTLRITPTSIVFLHHYDRNFILEVPVSELYETSEDSETMVVRLLTRNTNGSAILQLKCGSSRKRLAIFKTLCIRKNALERLKQQQEVISRTAPRKAL